MDEIPSFKKSVERFQDFLRTDGHEGAVVWAFREDFYSTSNARTWIRCPLPDTNAAVAGRCFEAGRHTGLVEIAALFRVGASIVATVFAPARDEIQGWNQGFKLSVRSPLTEAVCVPNGILWALHRCRPAYAHFQRRETLVHSSGEALGRHAMAYDFKWAHLIVACTKRLRDSMVCPVPFVDCQIIPPLTGDPDNIGVWFICDTILEKERFRFEALSFATERLRMMAVEDGFPTASAETLRSDVTSEEDIQRGGGRFYFFR